MLDTRDRHRLTPVSVDRDAADIPVNSGVASTAFLSRPHLTLTKGASTNVTLAGEQPNGFALLWPAHGDSRSTIVLRGWFVQSLLLEAIVREEVGESAAAHSALERALELAEPDRVVSPFLVDPIPELLERHTRRPTAYGALISEIFGVLAGIGSSSSHQAGATMRQPLTDGELRVLRLLATDLSKQEIGNELYVSVNTVKTHVKHLYAKLDVRTRRQAVERARALGLLAYSSGNH